MMPAVACGSPGSSVRPSPAGLAAAPTTALLFLLLALSPACSSGSLYRWGRYEDSLYESWLEPGSASPEMEIPRLSAQIEETVQAGEHVPPGLHAHLGWLYATQGDLDSARGHFLAEKETFPESARFIDGLLRRMDQKREEEDTR